MPTDPIWLKILFYFPKAKSYSNTTVSQPDYFDSQKSKFLNQLIESWKIWAVVGIRQALCIQIFLYLFIINKLLITARYMYPFIIQLHTEFQFVFYSVAGYPAMREGQSMSVLFKIWLTQNLSRCVPWVPIDKKFVI